MLFPLWVFLGSAIAMIYPPSFTWFSGPLIPAGLAVIMLGMGLTLTIEDFKRILEKPVPVFLGILLQFAVMPFLGWSIGILFELNDTLAAGLILVACCPGGTASNVIAFLARADVALSVSMTAVSTMSAVILTPVLTAFYIGNRVEVDAMGLFLSTLFVVIGPVVTGLLLNRYAGRWIKPIQSISPVFAVIAIVLIVSSIIGSSKETILVSGLMMIAAVVLMHTGGFLLGFFLSKPVADVQSSRTISIEVGMQNSGLGAYLARAHFTDPLTAVPSAISSLTHSILGSIAAAFWRNSRSSEGIDPGAGNNS